MRRLLQFLWVFTIAIYFGGCCKETIYQDPNTIVGKWFIASVDSGVMPNIPVSRFIFLGHLPDTGSVVFQKDSSGYFMTPIRHLTDTSLFFTWKHDLLNGLIVFQFPKVKTYAFVNSQCADSISLYFADYLEDPRQGSSQFYRLELKKP
jgi:hypothetical protein